MTTYNRGDVVLLPFTPPGSTGPGLRPAIVVSSQTYHQGRGHLLLAAATSHVRPPQTGDSVVQRWQEAGLKGPSLVTGVLVTAPPESIVKRLGSLAQEDLRAVDASLRLSLGV